jgi:hypothetical protein
VGSVVVIVHPLNDLGIGINSGFQPHDGTGIGLCCKGVAFRGCPPLCSGVCVSVTVAWVNAQASVGLLGLVIFVFQLHDGPGMGFGGLCVGYRGGAPRGYLLLHLGCMSMTVIADA